MLLEQFRNVSGVQSYHMACQAHGKNGNEISIDEDCDRITFLYKFIEGECPRSFGMNVARMAGLPQNVMELAKAKSREFNVKMGRMLKHGDSRSVVKAA